MFSGAQDATVLRVGWDASPVEKGVTNLNSRLKAAKSEMSATASQMGGFGRSTDGLKSKQEGLNKIYELQGQKVRDLKGNYDRLVETKGADSKAAIDASRSYNYALSEYARMENQLKDLTTEIIHQESAWGQMESGLQGFSDKTGKMAEGLGSFGKKMTVGVTLPVVGMGAAMLKTGMDFEQSMSNVQAVSGATGSDLKLLEEAARDMGSRTSKSASEAADGLSYMALAGWDTQQMISGLEPVLRLSEAGALDLGRASDLVTDSMSALQIEVEDLPKYLDNVTEASRTSNTSIDQLMEAYVTAGGNFAAFNVPLEESTAMLGLLANRGLKGSEAGRALNAIMVNLTSGAGQAGVAMEELNISAFDADGQFIGLEETLRLVKDATLDMTDEQKAQYISMIAGKEHLKSFQGLMAGLDDEYVSLKDNVSNADGALNEVATTMQDNAHGGVTQLKSAFEELSIQFANEMIPHFVTLTEGATDLVKWFSNLEDDTRRYIITAAGIAAVLGPAAIVLSTTLKSVSYLTGGLARAAGAYGRYSASAQLANTSTKNFSTTAAVTGTQLATANRGVGRFSGALRGVTGVASLAGVGMLAFGDESKAGLGTALMFAPELTKLGGKLLGAGKNALSGGARFLGMGKNAVTAGQGIGGLVRGVGAFGKAAGLLGGPVGWAVTAITTLGTVGYEVYKHYNDKVMPTFESFGDIVMENGEKISEATAEALDEYKTLSDDALIELNRLAWGSETITDEIANTMVGKFDEMGSKIKGNLEESYNEQLSDFEKFLGNYQQLSADEEAKYRAQLEDQYNGRVQSTQNNQDAINEIWRNAAEENREVTLEEQQEINRIKDHMMNMMVIAVAEGSEEQKVIMEQLKADSSIINTEQAIDTVKKALEAKEGAIAAANDKYDETVAFAIKQRDETGFWSAEEAQEVIDNALKQKNESITAAEDTHDGVIAAAQAQAEGHVDQINWATGEILSTWDHFSNSMLVPIRWMAKQVNKALEFFGSSSRVPEFDAYTGGQVSRTTSRQPKQQSIKVEGTGHSALAYEHGTNSNGHPYDSMAITSEAGQELVHDPKVGTYLTGNNGPELTYLHKGSSVLPAHHTKSLLSSYGFPAYETGVGGDMSWFDMLLGGPSAIIKNMTKSLGDWNNFSGMFKGLGDGIVNKIFDAASNYVTGFFGFGGEDADAEIRFAKGGGFPGMRKSSGYGPRWGSFHYGVDYAGPVGTPIPSQSNGRVSRSSTGFNGGYGNLLVVSSGPMDHYYAHNSRNLVRTGQPVAKGQIVALVGSTGRSTGPHVHYEQRLNGKRIKPQGYDHGGMSSMKDLVYVSERGQDEYHLSMHPSDYDRSMGMFMEIGERLGVFNPMPSVESIQQADTRSYGRSMPMMDNGTGMAQKIVELLKTVSQPIIQPGSINIDGRELTEIIFEYIDEKLEQDARLSNFSI